VSAAARFTLAIDTAWGQCAAALADADGLRIARAEAMARGQDARLAEMVREVLGEARVSAREVARVAVTSGPGSFTGVRIGLSFARAFALAVGAPCLGVNTLRAYLLGAPAGGEWGSAMPAPGGAYVAIYEGETEVVSPRRIEAGAAAGELAQRHPAARWRGPAAALFGAANTDVVDIAALATAARTLEPGAHPPNPLYLREPDAVPPRDGA
jgi:tRNA threonylcarbamoyladenosine biosynthesis protein TsaB